MVDTIRKEQKRMNLQFMRLNLPLTFLAQTSP